jgi:hypothetical protein
VDADRADGGLEVLALCSDNGGAADHGQHPIGRLVRVLDERTLLTTRDETASLRIAAIGENFRNSLRILVQETGLHEDASLNCI